MNGEKVRFCFQCGKEKEEGEEIDPKECLLTTENNIENLKQILQGDALQAVKKEINRRDIEWIEPDSIGARGAALQELGIVEKKRLYAPDGISDQEAEKAGFTSFLNDNNVRRYFRAELLVPNITYEELQRIILKVK